MVMFLMINLKKACEGYRSLGTNTRLIIRITLILILSLLTATMYALTATHAENHYELLLLTDELIQCAKSIAGIGTLGIIIVGITEEKSN